MYKFRKLGQFKRLGDKRKHYCCWQDETMRAIRAYKSLYLHCGPSTKALKLFMRHHIEYSESKS